MRLVVITACLALLSAPVAAHPHKRRHARAHHARAQPRPTIVPNDRQAEEHARAEAELSDLRAGKISDGADDNAAAAPAQTWAVQENDSEVPSNLRQSK